MSSIGTKTKPAENKVPPADSNVKPIREPSKSAGAVADGGQKQALKGEPKLVINPHHLTLLGERYDGASDNIRHAADELYKATDQQAPLDSNQSKQQAIEAKAYADNEYFVDGKGKNVPKWIDHIRDGVLKPAGRPRGTDVNRSALPYISQWLPTAISLHYNMTDPKIGTSFADFCLALATGTMGVENTSGTTMGNYKGEWRGGAFLDYDSITKGPLAR